MKKTKNKIEKLVDSRESKWGLFFDYFIQGLIILSLITFSIETIPDISDKTREIIQIIELVCVVIFTIEYLIRIIIAKKKLKFIFSFFGIIDLCAILPFYLSTGLDLRTIRALRLLRLFRMLKLVRYNKAIKRFSIAFKLMKEELIMFSSLAIILVFFSGVGIYYFENSAQPEQFSSIFSSLWWAVCTLTTVGYGDVFPITVGGKVFTFIILMIGLGIIAIPAGMISSALTEAREIEEKNNKE
ncbi:MAG: ion transporter [Vicingaceae bacterium]